MKTIPIELDRTRYLKLTNNGIMHISERIGLNLYEGGNIFNVTPNNLTPILYGLLMHEDDHLTEKQVGNMIGPENFNYIAERISALVEAITPKPEKKSRKAAAESETASETRPQ